MRQESPGNHFWAYKTIMCAIRSEQIVSSRRIIIAVVSLETGAVMVDLSAILYKSSYVGCLNGFSVGNDS